MDLEFTGNGDGWGDHQLSWMVEKRRREFELVMYPRNAHMVSPIRASIAILLSFVASTHLGHADDFIWRTGSITAEIRSDDKYLKMGQYLHLEQKLHKGEQGWTIMKIDLPESWTIEKITVGGGRVELRTKAGSTYILTRENVGKLDFEILNTDNKSDAVLEKIWKKHAL